MEDHLWAIITAWCIYMYYNYPVCPPHSYFVSEWLNGLSCLLDWKIPLVSRTLWCKGFTSSRKLLAVDLSFSIFKFCIPHNHPEPSTRGYSASKYAKSISLFLCAIPLSRLLFAVLSGTSVTLSVQLILSIILLYTSQRLSLIHIWRCRRSTLCRSRWSPYH